ncbi:MAG: EAL domain-containing protein, partial [Candidatus Eremiobacteraeota bacterium]|nr:EAL domain-containing protein [Candidatus Eremiobacteraeota bacterium]
MIRHSIPLHQRLSRALVHDEFEVNYQPLVELATGRVAGAEALIRWRQNDGTLIYPDAFIPQSEQTGFIIKLDQWVLATACAQFVQWRAQFRSDLFVAVNLSA